MWQNNNSKFPPYNNFDESQPIYDDGDDGIMQNANGNRAVLKYYNNNQHDGHEGSQKMSEHNNNFSSDESNDGKDSSRIMMPNVATDEEDIEADDEDHQSDDDYIGLYDNGEALNKLVDEF